MSILIGGILLLIVAGAGVWFLRHKNRLIWQQLWQLRDQLGRLHDELVEVRKQLVLSQVGKTLRLPAAMPSQYGEDLLLWNFFDRKRQGFYVEVGAYDGVSFSNTYFLEALGWNGLLVEPVPSQYRACLRSRPYSRVIHAAVGSGTGLTQFSVVEGEGGVETLSFMGENPQQLDRIRREKGIVRSINVPLRTLDQLLEGHPGDIDLVSIDVEGTEMDVLRGFDIDKFQPRVIVLEDNSNGTDTQATSWLASHGYIERYRCEHNVFYTRKEGKGEFQC